MPHECDFRLFGWTRGDTFPTADERRVCYFFISVFIYRLAFWKTMPEWSLGDACEAWGRDQWRVRGSRSAPIIRGRRRRSVRRRDLSNWGFFSAHSGANSERNATGYQRGFNRGFPSLKLAETRLNECPDPARTQLLHGFIYLWIYLSAVFVCVLVHLFIYSFWLDRQNNHAGPHTPRPVGREKRGSSGRLARFRPLNPPPPPLS